MSHKDNFERLQAIKAGNRGVVRKKINELNEIVQETKINGTIDEEQSERLDVLNHLLEGKLKTLQDIDQNVLELCELEFISNEIEDSERVLAKVVETQKTINDILQKRNNGFVRKTKLFRGFNKSQPKRNYQNLSLKDT